jgi:hypothetical protein
MRFSSTVKICLIPCRKELMPQIIELFWTSDDYINFKNDAVSELRSHLISNGITAKEAIFRLYQPSDEERKAWIREYNIDSGDRELSKSKEGLMPPASTSAVDIVETEEVHRYNSKEDDVPTYGDDVEGLKKFSNSGKTDIELNAERKIKESNGRRHSEEGLTKMPTKTPAGGSGDNQHIWAVTWKPQ